MGLREKLRDIELPEKLRELEQKGARSARRGFDRAKEEWVDAERRLRQKMRIYPERFARAKKADTEELRAAKSALPLPVGGRAAEHLHDPESPGTPIVSVHGHNLEIEIEEESEDNGCGHLTQSR